MAASTHLDVNTRDRTIVAVAAVLVLVLWPVEIATAFGLPAHPLLLHVPVVFIPVLGLAVIAAAVKPRYLLPVAAFAVLTLAATLLTVGAGEAFLETKPRLQNDQTMHDHKDAGITVRLTMVLLTFSLAGLLFLKRGVASKALTGLAVLLAVTAVGFTIRTGHLGSQLVWDDDQELTESTR